MLLIREDKLQAAQILYLNLKGSIIQAGIHHPPYHRKDRPQNLKIKAIQEKENRVMLRPQGRPETRPEMMGKRRGQRDASNVKKKPLK